MNHPVGSSTIQNTSLQFIENLSQTSSSNNYIISNENKNFMVSKNKNPFSNNTSSITSDNNSTISINDGINVQSHKNNDNTSQAIMIPNPQKNIGPLISNPESFGFKQFTHRRRHIPKFLCTQQPQLTKRKFVQDHWDKLNQRKMLNLENTIEDTTELYETLKKMRDTERKMMERKGLVDRADYAKNLNEAIVFQGTCEDMCPVFERARRNVELTVFSYEREPGENKKASRDRALKVFARPAAAAAPPLPSDVRPPHILVKTLDYIVDNLLTTLPKSESFLWDRMRSIRQDFTYQNYAGPEAVDCNERIVRIHLLILHVMIKTKTEFSIQQELEQLHKSLITLSEIYDDMRSNGFECPNEAEFRAYALLSKIRDPQYDQTIQELPSHIFNNRLVQLAVCFRQIISNSNYSERGYIKTENSLNFYLRFFQLLQSSEVPFLMGSFLQIYLGEVRFYSMKALSLSLNKKHKPIPIKYFLDTLLFNNKEELESFCQYYSISISSDAVDLKTLSYHSHHIVEKKPLPHTFLICIDNKIGNRTYAQLINSGKSNEDIANCGPNALNTNIIDGSTEQLVNQSSFSTNPKIISSFHTTPSATYNKPIKSPENKDQIFSKKSPTQVIPTSNTSLSITAIPFPAQSYDINPHTINETKTNTLYTAPTHPPKKVSLFNNVDRNNLSITSPKKDLSFNDSVSNVFTNGNANLDESKPQTIPSSDKTQEEEIIKNKLADKLTDALIKSTIATFVQDTITKANRTEQNRNRVINYLTNSLFNAFLHENIYYTFLDSQATVFSERTMKCTFLSKWKDNYNDRKNQRVIKKKQREDLQNVQKKLGVPQLMRYKLNFGTPITSSNTSFLLSSDKKTDLIFSPTYNEINNFSTQLEQNEDVWKPFNMRELYFEKVNSRVISSRNIEIDILLYSNNWTSISNKWLLTKFGLDDHKKVISIKENNFKLNVKCIDKNFDPMELDHTQLIVFNTGVTYDGIFDLDLKLQKDGEELIKLISNVSVRSEVCFNLLIVYWDSMETMLSSNNIARFLKLNRIEKSFNDVLLNIGFIKVTSNCPQKSLEEGLKRMARDFKCQLTERGRYKQKLYKRRSLTGSQVCKTPTSTLATIDEKMKRIRKIEDDKYKKQQDMRNTYAHLQSHIMASPKLYKTKLPVLLSASKQNPKLKTPMTKGNESFSTPAIPSHLVTKVQRKQHPIIPPATPCQGSYFPNASMVVHQTPIVTWNSNNSNCNTNNRTTSLFNFDARNPPIFQTPIQSIVKPMDQSVSSVDESHTIQELKNIIETVRKKVHSNT